MPYIFSVAKSINLWDREPEKRLLCKIVLVSWPESQAYKK